MPSVISTSSCRKIAQSHRCSGVTLELVEVAQNHIKFIDVPLEQALDISHSQNIYAYDAYLIQCAQQTSTSLLTLDNRLKVTAIRMGIHVMEVMQ